MMTAIERLPRDISAAAAFSNGARTPYERDLSIDRIFTETARVHPSAPAITDRDCSFTYDVVERGSNRIANALVSLGIKPGAAVGVAFERSTILPPALLGILKAGAAYVPLDPSYPSERTNFMIADAGVALVVTDAADHLPDIPIPRVQVAKLLDHENEERPAEKAGPSSLAYIIFTSGSTGQPKGVAVEHRGVVRLVCDTDYLAIGIDDTFLHFAPLAFDASTFEIWAPLLNGARLAVPKPGLMSMHELAETIDRFDVTAMFLTTALFQRFVDTPSARPRSLRTLLTGGEIASPVHMERFLRALPSCRLVAVYGPTENTTFSTWCDISEAELEGSVPIGKPIANSTAFVLDERLRPLPVGAEGELYLGGDGVAREYVNRPELTAERFVCDPFAGDPGARLYRSGDRARWRTDGLLEFLGRTDDQVKVRGFRIELGEIELALQKHAAVGDAAVVVIERSGEKELVAHVVLCSEGSTSEHQLRAWLSRSLPAFMMPHRIRICRELPLTSSGKVDRIALARSATGPAREEATRSPSVIETGARGLERTIAEIWRDVLGCDTAPGLDENFFDAGGDSLRLLAVHTRIRERLAADVDVTDLFEHGTIRGLAAFINAERERS